MIFRSVQPAFPFHNYALMGENSHAVSLGAPESSPQLLLISAAALPLGAES